MTKNCELCGRGMAKKELTPYFWPHDTVCGRARCLAAVVDALSSQQEARERCEPLADAIATRHKSQVVPIGYRQDSMADIAQNEVWWATEAVKRV